MHRLQSSSSHYSSFTQSYYCVSYSIRVLLIYLWQNGPMAREIYSTEANKQTNNSTDHTTTIVQ